MRITAIIPARYKSTRFEGKPLAEINGHPMLAWCYRRAKKATILDEVYVATDDERIENMCIKYNIPVIMTSPSHPTGTDRVAEAAKKLSSDIYINIQGDQPLIEPSVIEKAALPFSEGHDIQVTNLMAKITNPVDVVNPTIPKVIANRDGDGIYLTRSAAPYPHGGISFNYYRQVCVYGFTPGALGFFAGRGRGALEQAEDIEILRFIENGQRVKYIEVESDSISVDTAKDLERVRAYIGGLGIEF